MTGVQTCALPILSAVAPAFNVSLFATNVFEPSTSCLMPLVSAGTEFMSDCVPAEDRKSVV